MHEDQFGLAVPSEVFGATISRLSLVGIARSETHHVGIAINTVSSGDRMSGKRCTQGTTVDHVTFSGLDQAAGWTTCVHNDVSGGFVIKNCLIRTVIGSRPGFGYGILVSGDDVLVERNTVLAPGFPHGRHAIYFSFSRRATARANYCAGFVSTGIVANTTIDNTNDGLLIEENDVISCSHGSTNTDDSAIGLYVSNQASAGGSAIVRKNKIVSAGCHGIFSNFYSGLEVSQNWVIDFGSSTSEPYCGIEVWNTLSAHIFDNQIVDHTQRVRPGIRLKQVSDGEIRSNRYFNSRYLTRESNAWIERRGLVGAKIGHNSVLSAGK